MLHTPHAVFAEDSPRAICACTGKSSHIRLRSAASSPRPPAYSCRHLKKLQGRSSSPVPLFNDSVNVILDTLGGGAKRYCTHAPARRRVAARTSSRACFIWLGAIPLAAMRGLWPLILSRCVPRLCMRQTTPTAIAPHEAAAASRADRVFYPAPECPAPSQHHQRWKKRPEWGLGSGGRPQVAAGAAEPAQHTCAAGWCAAGGSRCRGGGWRRNARACAAARTPAAFSRCERRQQATESRGRRRGPAKHGRAVVV